jgi:undecaprenyldiphospho-muramoylpentapeptide beta-N-acetylglucosaminyltransferase
MTAFAVVAGGGTAGHVLPALAVGEALAARGHPPSEVHYVGARRGIETRLVPSSGHPYTFYDVQGLQRRLTLSNLLVAPKLLVAVARCVALLGRLRPRVVVSVGGYASLPAVFAAVVRRIPVVVVSYDRRPGLASRVSARVAAAVAAAFDGTPLPRVRVTGAPLRRSVLAVDRAGDRDAARDELGVPRERVLVAVLGGSQGSGALNAAVERFVTGHAGRRDLAVYHLVGERFLASASAPRDGADGIWYRPVGFESRMPALYAACDLLVGRAGASTVAEVAATATPSVLVPWPGAAEDHQTDNARTLSDVGGALLLPETDIERLPAEIDRLLADGAARAVMAAAARRAGEVHRSGRLGDLLVEVAEHRKAARGPAA